jgi:hypothetical protein
VVLHLGQPVASLRVVSDTTNPQRGHITNIKTRERSGVSSLQAKTSG